MKSLIKPYRHLIALALVLCVAISGVALGIIHSGAAFLIVGLFQLSQFAISRRQAGVFFVAGLTQEQIDEFTYLTKEIATDYPKLKELPNKLKTLEMLYDNLNGELRKLRKNGIGGAKSGVRWIGNKAFVSDECAQALTSVLVLDCNRIKGALDSMVPDEHTRKQILTLAQGYLGIEQRTAMTSNEVPLPTIYVPQIVELVFAYGAARQHATVFPLGSGLVKLPRLKAGEDDFGYLGAGTAGQSQPVGEKKVAAELVTFTANKAGGLIRLPYELQEDTFIPIGQWLARYIARQLAKLEDKTLFIADGTPTYANQTGVGPYCVANPDYLLQLDAAKTKVSDMTLDDLRNLRGKVSAAVLANMAANGQTDAAYYFHPSMEPLLRSFNKYPNFVVFTNENGKPMFDGWPVRWIGVGATNNGQAQPGTFAAFFGDLSYWYLGERGAVRVEVSKEVFFATDEIAMRALERIDVEAMAIDAMAAIRTGAGA
ncbi:MAG: phage major capsid protein [Verrucomicrobiota bacterium]